MSLLTKLAGNYLKLPRRRPERLRSELDIPVPMSDGATLLANRWFLEGQVNPPTILMRSPYGRKGMMGTFAQLLAERGFQVVIQSCRGTAGSGGVMDPMRQEKADGVDTIHWVRAQPWYSLRLYTYGSSYLGYVQWALAREAAPYVNAMALHVTLSNFRNETLGGGGFTQEGSITWTKIIAAQKDGVPLWQQLLLNLNADKRKRTQSHLPLGDLDEVAVGQRISWWRDWVGHDDPADPWWNAVDRSADVPEITVPAIMVGGWRDIFLPSQVADFVAMQARGRDAWLTIGPWTHSAMAGMAEALREAIDFFSADAAGEIPFHDRDWVRLYVMGAEEWRDYPSWPPPGSRELCLYLQPHAALSLAPPPTGCAPTAYDYDPADPTPSLHGPSLMSTAKRPDMSALERRRDTISFTSSSLTADFEVIGAVRAELSVASNTPNTDFYVCLCDVDAAGRPLHVVDGYIRLRPEPGLEQEYAIRRVVIECWPTAYRFKQSHKIRLIVASGAHPRYARNLGTGEPSLTATRMITAHQRVFHDADAPSSIYLTIAGKTPAL